MPFSVYREIACLGINVRHTNFCATDASGKLKKSQKTIRIEISIIGSALVKSAIPVHGPSESMVNTHPTHHSHVQKKLTTDQQCVLLVGCKSFL